MEDIDRINFCFSTIWQQFRRMLEPHILGQGVDIEDDFPLGKMKFWPLPEGADMKVLEFPFNSSYLQAIDSSLALI